MTYIYAILNFFKNINIIFINIQQHKHDINPNIKFKYLFNSFIFKLFKNLSNDEKKVSSGGIFEKVSSGGIFEASPDLKYSIVIKSSLIFLLSNIIIIYIYNIIYIN